MTDRPDPADWITRRRELLAAATEGPWEADGTEISQHCMAYCYGGSGRGIEREDDANLIADARTSLPRALDALEAVLALHRPHICGDTWGTQGACFIGHGGCMSGGTCRGCRMSYPCPTVAAVTGALS